MAVFLTLCDVKEGGLVMSPGEETLEDLRELLEKHGANYRILGEDERGMVDRLLGRKSFLNSKGLFFTMEDGKLEKLEDSDGGFYGLSTGSVGEFLGYPDDAIQHYLGSEIPGKETVEKVKQEFESMDLEYLALVSYIPAPNEDSVEAAVKEGRSRSEFIDERSEELEYIPELRDRLLEESVWTGSSR